MPSLGTTIVAVLASILALGPVSTACALENPIHTESGLIAGAAGDISVYKGIPYAAPPVAELRWKAPLSAPRWSGVREAKDFGSQCVYRGPGAFAGAGSEDCLTLNVWTPAKHPRERLPVMVWIHGGGFQFGSGRWPLYEGTSLARRGVVLVTLNYRLNIFGFSLTRTLSKSRLQVARETTACSIRSPRCSGLREILLPLAVMRTVSRFSVNPPAAAASLIL